MDLVEIARLDGSGMIVLNPERHAPWESSIIEESIETVWEASAEAISAPDPASRPVLEAGYQLKALVLDYNLEPKRD